MAKLGDVLEMLVPQGGWICSGEDFANVVWVDESVKITKKQYDDGFAAYDAWKAKQDADAAAKKAAILAKLGITAEEAALLLA